jgi:hypothetical protein
MRRGDLNMKRVFSAFVFLAGIATQTVAAERPVAVRGIRPLGMGDAFTAIADDQNVFFYNPAGSVQRTKGLVTILELPATIGTDLMDAYDYISDNEDKLTKFNELSAQEQANLINEIDRTITKLNPSFGVGGPNSNYVSGPIGDGYHWGFGVFGQAQGSFRLNTGIVPNLDYDVNWDIVPMGNVSKRWENVWRVPGKIGVGANLKYIQRSQIKDERVSFLQLEDFESPPLQAGRGFGMDLGVLYQPNDRWTTGLAINDFLGTSLDFDSVSAEKGFSAKPSRTGTIKPRVNVGAAWTPSRLTFWPGRGLSTGHRLVLAADLKDVANSDSPVLFDGAVVPDQFWAHLHLGAEYRWWFTRLRVGANQGYPTFGLGFDLPLVKLDYAYYSDELTQFAGGLQQSNHMLTLAVRFGSGGTEARERIAGAATKAAPVAPAAATSTATDVPAADTPTPDEAVPVEKTPAENMPTQTAPPAEPSKPARQ